MFGLEVQGSIKVNWFCNAYPNERQNILPCLTQRSDQANANIEIQNGNQDAYFLILEGKPIGEPVAQYGPFVMNTQEEIQQAMKDYGRTQFGGWPWSEREVVHHREKGRFALHTSGKEENK